MKTINFLFGSGIHFLDGNERYLPGTIDLTEKILNYDIVESSSIPDIREQHEIKNFIKLLHKKCLNYYQDYKTKVTYEDIFYLIGQLIDDANGFKYNPAIDDFRKSVFFENGWSSKDIASYGKILIFLRKIEKKVKGIISYNLRTNGIGNHLNILKDIYNDRTVKVLNICSLNHDPEFEKYFHHNGLPYNDGFKKEVMNNGFDRGFKFEINNFNVNFGNKINLLKNHGSIDWYNYGDQYFYKIRDKDIPMDNPLILMGTYNKLDFYNMDIFKDIFILFNNILSESNYLIISGYGFQDKWINFIVDGWLRKNDSNKIILIHPNKDKLINEELRETYIHNKFDVLVKQKKLIFLKKSFHKTTWPELSDIIL